MLKTHDLMSLQTLLIALSARFLINTILTTTAECLNSAVKWRLGGYQAQKEKPLLDTTKILWDSKKKMYSSLMGGIKETQEMLDFGVKYKIYPKVQIIPK